MPAPYRRVYQTVAARRPAFHERRGGVLLHGRDRVGALRAIVLARVKGERFAPRSRAAL